MPYNLLKQKNPYFRNLSPDAQELFVSRVYDFMNSKEFIGRENLVITDEMRVLISASAIQLTFGLKEYSIRHLHTINVFPEIFYSKLFETHFKGLNTQGGILSLSWTDFKEGYIEEHDKINLGLHELAHSLNIDLDENGNYDAHFFDSFERWKKIGFEYFQKLRTGEINFLRSYGKTNMHEFFAVCIEHFFEAPEEFKARLPGLYWITAFLLNQDPCNITGNYQLKMPSHDVKSVTVERTREDNGAWNVVTPGEEYAASEKERINNFFKGQAVNIAIITTFTGLFVGIPVLIWFWYKMIIDVGSIFVLIFLCGGLGLLQWRFVRNYLDLQYYQFAMYAFAGFGMCFVNFLLFLNSFIGVGKHSETYDLGVGKRNLYVIAGQVENSPLTRNLTNFLQTHDLERPKNAQKITIVYSRGLLGFDEITNVMFN